MCDRMFLFMALFYLAEYTRSGAQGLADCFIHWMCNFNNLPYYCCGVLYIARVRLIKSNQKHLQILALMHVFELLAEGGSLI